MRRRCWVIVLLLMITIPMSAQAADPILVPSGATPILNGTLSDDEWADALAIPLNEDCTLFLKHAHGYMYLAVRATTRGIPSPLIVRGSDVRVLHASAALGTAIYTQEEEAWILTQGFTWQCRTRGFTASAVAERDLFLEQEGWLGTIGYLGTPTEFEYLILLGEEPLQMLFLFLETTNPFQVLSWPVFPDTAASYLEIITGPIPGEATFDLNSWAVLLPFVEDE
jgi:hypothetical protein